MNSPAQAKSTSVQDIYPLSPTQQGMLFHSLLEPQSGAYVIQVAFTLDGDLNQQAFAQAWAMLQTRHSVLRTAFAWEKLDRPVQVVGAQAKLPIETIIIDNLSNEAQTDHIMAWQEQDREQGFDPRRAPLMRVTLFRLSSQRFRVIWSYHHLLLDGWSLPLLLQEWIACYIAAEQQTQPTLPPAPPYRDFIAWLQQQNPSKAMNFWQEQLRGFDAPTPLPMADSAQNSGSAHTRQTHVLDKETSQHLAEFARREHLTLSTLIQGAWSLLLWRYGGGDDLVYGLARSGRPTSLTQFAQRVGLFLNLLPMRVKIDAKQPVKHWLSSIQQEQIAQQPFEYASLREVQEVSELTSTTPLFESIVVFENYPSAPDATLGERQLQLSDIDVNEQTNYPLSLYAAAKDQLELRLLYDTQRFTADTIERLFERFSRLLKDIAHAPEKAIGELAFISSDDFSKAHIQPNLTRNDDTAIGVDASLKQHARDSGAQAALICGSQTLSYQVLDHQVQCLSDHLERLGIRSGQRIGLCLDRSVDMVIALLAVLRRGCAYLPLDPGYPSERLQYIVEDAGMAAIIVHQATRDSLTQGPVFIDLDQDRVQIETGTAQTTAQQTVASAQPDNDEAYLIYTSGSTGKPKGVCISHPNLNNLLTAMGQRIGFDHSKRLLAVTTLAFDIATLELLLPLVNGGCLVLADEQQSRDATALAQLLEQQHIDVMQATPATWRLLMAINWPGNQNLQALCGGEALDVALAQQLMERSAAVWNVYGPTETTIWSAALKLTKETVAESAIPFGHALNNTVLHVLDEQQRPLPIGVPGELYIGGHGVAIGYKDREQLTAERFIDNPLPVEPSLPVSPRLYRTGDLVRQREDGLFDFLGRTDQQIKIRGYRIELGEIEARLLKHEEVDRAVVELLDADTPRARLAAVIVPQQNAETLFSNKLQEAEYQQGLRERLQEHLKRQLPVYMLPSAYHAVTTLPTTPNGKLDRAAVRRLVIPATGSGAAPRTPLERTLAEIWQEVLGNDKVGPDDNFFEIGGHSLLVVKAREQLQERLDVELALIDLFRYPTPATLARHIEQLKNQSNQTSNKEPEAEKAQDRKNQGMARRQAQRARRQRGRQTQKV